MAIRDRLQHAWNALMNRDPTHYYYPTEGMSYSYRPDRVRLSRGNERTIVTAIYNRIAMDVAAISIRHVKLDENDRFSSYIKSGLDNCLTVEANIDQTGRNFIQDVVLTMLNEGVVAIVPVDTTLDPKLTGSFDILSMRTGIITEWRPRDVKVKVYNDRTGEKEEIWLPKKSIAIIENPLYAVVNQSNSIMQRLIRKLALLDAIDEQSGSGKLDMIIQLPYTIKTTTRRQEADKRRADLESQLTGSKYGIGYIDATERITQLNRPVENNLMKQIEYLTSMAYAQLGINQSILDSTADEKTNLNYATQTVEPIVSAIVGAMIRSFLTKTARTQHQSIMFFRDVFKLVPVAQLAETADKLTRNEIASKNEIRQVLGWKPSDDPKADQLINSNISQPNGSTPSQPIESDEETEKEGGDIQNGS